MLDGFEGGKKWAIFGLLLACHVYFLQIYPHFISPNELSRLLLTSAMVDDHSLSVDNAIKRYGHTQDMASFGGHYYSDKAIGVSVLGIPAFLAMRGAEFVSGIQFSTPAAIFWLRLITITVPSILFLGLFSKFWSRLKPDSKYIPHFVFLHLFGTVVFTYTMQFVSHYLLGIFLFSSACYLNEYRIDEQRPARLLILAGVFAGFSLLLEFPAIFPVTVIGIFALTVVRVFRRFVYFAVPVVSAVVLILLCNYAIFGTPWDVTYRHMTSSFHVSAHAKGIVGIGFPTLEALYGLLFSRHHGLFFISPFLLLSLPGYYYLLATERWSFLAGLFIGIVVSTVLIYSAFSYWIAGWNFGPRYLTSIIPFLSTAAFYFGDDFLRKDLLSRSAFVAVAIWSVLCATIGTITFPFPPDNLTDPVFFLNIPLLLNGATGLNLFGNPWFFFTLPACTFLVMTFIPGKKLSPAKLIAPGFSFLAFTALLFTVAFLSRPAPTAMEYYARGSVYLYLGRYDRSLSEMYLALDARPDDKSKLLIQERINHLARMVPQ